MVPESSEVELEREVRALLEGAVVSAGAEAGVAMEVEDIPLLALPNSRYRNFRQTRSIPNNHCRKN